MESGTDYVDLCGEVLWMHDMIDRFHARAVETASGVVFRVARTAEAGARQQTERALLERLDLARTALTRTRAMAPSRGGQTRPLSTEEIAELASMGYAGLDTQPSVTSSKRLCLDGCVWE